MTLYPIMFPGFCTGVAGPDGTSDATAWDEFPVSSKDPVISFTMMLIRPGYESSA